MKAKLLAIAILSVPLSSLGSILKVINESGEKISGVQAMGFAASSQKEAKLRDVGPNKGDIANKGSETESFGLNSVAYVTWQQHGQAQKADIRNINKDNLTFRIKKNHWTLNADASGDATLPAPKKCPTLKELVEGL